MYQIIFGQLKPQYKGSYTGDVTSNFGLIIFLNNIIKLLFLVGGLIAFLNLVLAGFQFLNAGGDPKAIEQAWNKIWQSLIGLLILTSSFLIAAIAGLILYGDPGALLNPILYGA